MAAPVPASDGNRDGSHWPIRAVHNAAAVRCEQHLWNRCGWLAAVGPIRAVHRQRQRVIVVDEQPLKPPFSGV
jgi:hypothetical protein